MELPVAVASAGEARWLTVASPADPDGVELLLGPVVTAVFDDTCGNCTRACT